jgi:hypothetical protein
MRHACAGDVVVGAGFGNEACPDQYDNVTKH